MGTQKNRLNETNMLKNVGKKIFTILRYLKLCLDNLDEPGQSCQSLLKSWVKVFRIIPESGF